VNVAEGLIGDVKFRFVNEEGQKVDNNSNPIKVRTKKDFLRQQLKLKPGKVFQDKLVQDDVQTLYKLGLFKTVNVAFEGDATKVDLIYELQEVGGRSVNLGGGYNGYDGISVVVSYKDQNVGGVNDTLGANNGEKVREGKIGGSVSVEQQVHGWDASVGLNYSHVTIRDHEGNITRRDANNNQLSFSDTGIDNLTAVSFTATKEEPDNPVKPTQGCLVTFSTEQSIPVGHGQITMNRLRGNYS
jgi:outer membrane protein insertion porin family